jgi:hypothetical protein
MLCAAALFCLEQARIDRAKPLRFFHRFRLHDSAGDDDRRARRLCPHM